MEIQVQEAAFWAALQNRLGTTYTERRRGKPGHNVEGAIAAYTPALGVLSLEKSPIDWAMAQSNLGPACSKRTEGDRADWRVDIGSEWPAQTGRYRGFDS